MAKGWLFLGRNKQSKTEAVNVDNGALEVKTVGNNVLDTLYAHPDTTIAIATGASWVSDAFPREKANLLRISINFNNVPIEQKELVEIWIASKGSGLAITGTARGYLIEVPFIATRSSFNPSSPAYSESTSMAYLSDGDVPVFDEDCYIIVRNRTNQEITLRNINVIRVA